VSAAEYVDVVYPDCWGTLDAISDDEHADACQRATDWLTEHEGEDLSITMRPGRTGRHSEIAQIYRVGRGGELLTAAYGDEAEVERVRDLIAAAYEHACETWVVLP